jgi:3-oxoacyl-[acyl-carrier-protein] synthase-1
MATIIADNIISPLGDTTQANYQAVKAGKSALRPHNVDSAISVPFLITASLFSEEQKNLFSIDGFTIFESLAITSIKKSLKECQIPMDEKTCLIISTTKGVQEFEGSMVTRKVPFATRIAQAVGITTTPIIVCNACISGVSALILGNRLIEMQQFDFVIVCGLDLQSTFIVSGFQSLKALSETECRPFDMERTGLNLGEAAATVILSREEKPDCWHITSAAIRNDAYHISSPSPKAEGCLMTIEAAMRGHDINRLALINAHGTGTLYNDQMEARGISKAGLANIPTNALKGYFGHTMGAAGILETIITMHGIDDHTIIATKGYNELGVSGNLNIIRNNTFTTKTDFLKIISGFGGCNAAILLTPCPPSEEEKWQAKEIKTLHKIAITPQSVQIDNKKIDTGKQTGKDLITWLYKSRINDYPKFYKMDALARLGFVATELLLQKERETEKATDQQARALIFFNQSSSEHADRVFLSSISDPENFFPSPSAFVYTLPNIVNGEIAVRNSYHGETVFCILPQKDYDIMRMITKATMQDKFNKSIITGWLEYKNEKDFLAELNIVH